MDTVAIYIYMATHFKLIMDVAIFVGEVIPGTDGSDFSCSEEHKRISNLISK